MRPSTSSLLMSLVSMTHASYMDCGAYFSGYGVTFDLSPLTLTDQSALDYYEVHHATANYEFLFNFCADIISNPYPGACNFEDRKVKDRDFTEYVRPKNTSAMAWQAVKDGNGFCFRVSGPKMSEDNKYNTSDLITYKLIDDTDPSLGILMHYNYGDWDSGCGWTKNRQFDIGLVCDPSIDNIPDSGEIIYEESTCQYYMEIKSIYGCPLECGRDVNGTLCSGNGLCGYDHGQNTAQCKCYSGFTGDICNETAPLPDTSWYDAIGCESNSTYSFEFDTLNGHPIHYDLQWFVDGYLNSSNGFQRYQLNGASDDDHYYYLNLFETQPHDPSICLSNPGDYEYGLLYQAHKTDANAPCFSIGREIGNVTLFEPTLPGNGIKLTLTNGDGTGCPDDYPRETDVYLICPSSTDELQKYRGSEGLNREFSRFQFSESDACRYAIEIYTATACPCECVSYDSFKDGIDICNQNGMCGYDKTLDLVRCFCNDGMIIDGPEDVHCFDPTETYNPTENPTAEPTQSPTSPPVARLECGDFYEGGLSKPYANDTFLFSVYWESKPYGAWVTFDACDSAFDTYLNWDYMGGRVAYNDENFAVCGTTGPSYLRTFAFPDRNYTLEVTGFSDNYGRYSLNITCEDETAYPSKTPTQQPTSPPTEGYSLEGQWTKYDWHTDMTLEAKISVDEMCQFVKFEFVNSNGCSDSWFGFGIGGTYGFDMTEPFKNMNGYAILSFTGDMPEGSVRIYETTLQFGSDPFPGKQSAQNLRNCTVETRDCMQYIECYRDFMTSDSENDFYMFTAGINNIIWAHGNVDNGTFMPMKHSYARQDVINLHGESMCYSEMTTTEEMKDMTTTMETKDIDEASKEGGDEDETDTDSTWMIVAIIFIVLFVLLLLCLIYKIYSAKHKAVVSPLGYMHGRINSTDNVGSDRGNEMATLTEADGNKTKNPTDDDLL